MRLRWVKSGSDTLEAATCLVNLRKEKTKRKPARGAAAKAENGREASLIKNIGN